MEPDSIKVWEGYRWEAFDDIRDMLKYLSCFVSRDVLTLAACFIAETALPYCIDDHINAGVWLLDAIRRSFRGEADLTEVQAARDACTEASWTYSKAMNVGQPVHHAFEVSRIALRAIVANACPHSMSVCVLK